GESRLAPGVSQPRHLGLVASYDQGPLHAAISYANTENDADLDPGAGVTASSATAWTIGAAYDFKTFVLGALYEKAERDVLGGDVESDYFRIAFMLPFGQHELHLNYGWVDTDPSNAGAKQYTLGYNYNITKTTKVYAFYTVVDNESGGTFGFRTASPGADNKSIAGGLRHNF
ncbi:MAG: porin, partial [Burkholderiales bacterium]